MQASPLEFVCAAAGVVTFAPAGTDALGAVVVPFSAVVLRHDPVLQHRPVAIVPATQHDSLRTLDDAFRLMTVLAHTGPADADRLAAESDLSATVVDDALGHLIQLGATQVQGTRYALGPKLFQLTRSWPPRNAIRAAISRPLHQLSKSTTAGGFSVSITEGPATIVLTALGREIDEVFPMHAGTQLPPDTAAQLVFALSDHSPTPTATRPATGNAASPTPAATASPTITNNATSRYPA
ncbi:hypothetical protein [Nocardia sp. NPDC020380]|uniref:hypothetical protein n=1 Tax=Nocardia sp. NPDC020380 TaxID=3364309 RepID=UPI003789145F